MTASKANGFAQIQYDPTGTSCNAIPYDFHPMYSTSSEKTSVSWGADPDNIAFTDEIGHAQLCTRPESAFRPASSAWTSSGNPIACPAGDFEEPGIRHRAGRLR